MSTIGSMNQFEQYPHVRVVANSNQSGTYFNGQTNNGVGATFTYATGALTIDSVTVNAGDFVLFAGQTSAYQNGIYQCIVAGATGVAAVLQRRGDMQCIEQISGGHYIPVSAGTSFGGSVWTVIEPLPVAIGAPASGTANNINFATITAAGSSLYLQVANNLSDLNNKLTAQTNLGIKRATTAVYAGGGTSNAFTATGLVSTDIVVATILTSTNSVSITKAVPTANTLTVTFSADPGANTTVNWIAIATV